MKVWINPANLLCPCGRPMQQVEDFDVETGISIMACQAQNAMWTSGCKTGLSDNDKRFRVQLQAMEIEEVNV